MASVQLEHETNRKPRNARSSSHNRSQAIREGNAVDGSGCDCWLQCLVGTSLEMGVETRQQAAAHTSSRQNAQAVGAPADRIDRGIGSRHAVLGIRTGRLDRTFGARHDPAIVRRAVSSGVCAASVASIGLESAEAGAPRRERDEAEIARWRRECWPRLKKEPRTSS